MEAAALEPPIPPRPALRLVRTGPRGRSDVFRPTDCPDHHGGRIRIDRIVPSGAFHTRVGYRCSRWAWSEKEMRWVETRHRFTDRTPEDPLPRRHPTHEHPYHQDTCALCETTYAPDEGLRAGRNFYFAAHDIATHLMGITKGHPIQPTIADVRRDAVRYRPRTRSHLPDPDASPEQPVAPRVEPDWPDLPLDEPGEQVDADRLDEPAWLADAPAIAEPRRSRYRGWGERLRIERGELALVESLPPPEKMVGDDRFLSRSFALGAEYLDVFGPAVCAPHRREIWPDAIAIDSIPLNRRTKSETPSEMEVARTESDFLCEVFGVLDATNHELMLLYPAGSKDRESVKEVFGQMKGRPTWVVTDGDAAMPKAIEQAFGPDAIHYRCEDHLRKDAIDAAKRDGVEDKVVFAAIERAQRSPDAWSILRKTVAARAPYAERLAKWIEANEDLVLHQVELRRLYPGRPYSTGALEGHLVVVREALERRRVTLRNRNRLVIVLDLIRLGRAHLARPERFRTIIRQQLEATRNGKIAWQAHWDHWDRSGPDGIVRRNSIIEYRDQARRRSLVANWREENEASIARVQSSYTEARAEAHAAGGIAVEPKQPTRRLLIEVRPGDRVADVPEMLATWDFERNRADGLSATEIGARARVKECHWICREHEAGDPEGRWPAHTHRWQQAPEYRLRNGLTCRFCQRKEVCPRNSLRTTHPNLADPAVWDYTTNDARGFTPDNTSLGQHDAVSCLCARHGPYEQQIRVRVRGHGCQTCGDEEARTRARETENRRNRERRAKAREIWTGRTGEVLPFERDDA